MVSNDTTRFLVEGLHLVALQEARVANRLIELITHSEENSEAEVAPCDVLWAYSEDYRLIHDKEVEWRDGRLEIQV